VRLHYERIINYSGAMVWRH